MGTYHSSGPLSMVCQCHMRMLMSYESGMRTPSTPHSYWGIEASISLATLKVQPTYSIGILYKTPHSSYNPHIIKLRTSEMGDVIQQHPNRRDRGQVEVLSGMGASEAFIAKHLKLSIEELRLHYAPEIEHGQEEANLQVARTFHEMATSGEHPQMTLAWMKMRAKWTDGPTIDSPDDEEDTQIDEAREKLLKLLNRGK